MWTIKHWRNWPRYVNQENWFDFIHETNPSSSMISTTVKLKEKWRSRRANEACKNFRGRLGRIRNKSRSWCWWYRNGNHRTVSRIIYCDVNLLKVLLLIPISVWMHDWNEILQMWSLADIIHSCEFNFFRPPNWSACFFLPSRLRSPNLKIHHVYSANLQENWRWVLKF